MSERDPFDAELEQLRADNERLQTRYDSATDQAVRYAAEIARLHASLKMTNGGERQLSAHLKLEADNERLRTALQAMLDCHGKPHRADWISDAAYQHAVEVDAQARRALEPKP